MVASQESYSGTRKMNDTSARPFAGASELGADENQRRLLDDARIWILAALALNFADGAISIVMPILDGDVSGNKDLLRSLIWIGMWPTLMHGVWKRKASSARWFKWLFLLELVVVSAALVLGIGALMYFSFGDVSPNLKEGIRSILLDEADGVFLLLIIGAQLGATAVGLVAYLKMRRAQLLEHWQ